MNGLLCKNPKNLVSVSEQEYKYSLLRAAPLQRFGRTLADVAKTFGQRSVRTVQRSDSAKARSDNEMVGQRSGLFF